MTEHVGSIPLHFQLAFVAIALLLASDSNASVPPTGEAKPLKSLSEWLLRTGKPTVMRSRILEAVNLPAIDMPLRERGFRHQGERITHVCSVITTPGYQDLLFFAQVDESDGSATIWRTGWDGALVSTVRFAEGKVERVPNEHFISGFTAEKLIFLTKMRIQ